MRSTLQRGTLNARAKKLAQANQIPYQLAERVCNVLDNNEVATFVRIVLSGILDLTESRPAAHVSIFEIQAHLSATFDTWLSERSVKAAVKDLVETHSIAIGSARGKDHGYFLIVTDGAAQAATRPLLAEIRSLARRCRALDPRTNRYLRGLLGQMEVGA
jgi:hypothetical protein